MAKGRVLIVEDDEDNRHLVAFLLRTEGYEILEADDGREGLNKVHQEHPDMILLDMSIPEIDGWALARLIKSDPQTQPICIVALTGHTLPGDRKKALDAGCDGYISKPLDLNTFVDKVDAFLTGKPQAEEAQD